MSKYPKIVMDETKNTPTSLSTPISIEQYYDLLYHTHKVSDLVGELDTPVGEAYDDTELRELIETKVNDLYNKIMGITDEDSTTVNEAYDTLKEVSKYITEDGKAASEMLKKIAAIEVALESKVSAVDGKSLVDNAEIERLSKVDNYDDSEIKQSISNIVQYDKETVKQDLVTDNYIDKRGEPYLNEEFNCFFANGVPITVEEDPENSNGVIIKWGFVGSAKIADASTLYIYGGSDGYVTPKSLAHTKVTVNSGYVRCLYAGGCANCVVDNAEVIINGGTVKNIMGGGRASDRRDALNRSAVVYNSKITMNGGICSMLVGGSVGYGITEKVSITINDGSITGYLIAGGSNGAVENTEVNINGGNIKLFQSTNRGYMTDVEFNMTGGSINNIYCGGEPTEDVDGTINSFKCNITGGTIINMAVGTDGSTAKATNVEYVERLMSLDKISGTVVDGIVINISDELKNKLK